MPRPGLRASTVSLNVPRPAALLPIGSFIIAVGVEGRVKVDKVNRLAVHPPEDVEVVARPDRSYPRSSERPLC